MDRSVFLEIEHMIVHRNAKSCVPLTDIKAECKVIFLEKGAKSLNFSAQQNHVSWIQEMAPLLQNPISSII